MRVSLQLIPEQPASELVVPAGEVERALALTPDELADRLVVAGTPDDWVEWLSATYQACGDAWAGVQVEGLPGLVEQVRMFGEEVLPRL